MSCSQGRLVDSEKWLELMLAFDRQRVPGSLVDRDATPWRIDYRRVARKTCHRRTPFHSYLRGSVLPPQRQPLQLAPGWFPAKGEVSNPFHSPPNPHDGGARFFAHGHFVQTDSGQQYIELRGVCA